MTSLSQSPGNVLFVAHAKPQTRRFRLTGHDSPDYKTPAPFESPTVGQLSWCNLFAPSRGTEVACRKGSTAMLLHYSDGTKQKGGEKVTRLTVAGS